MGRKPKDSLATLAKELSTHRHLDEAMKNFGINAGTGSITAVKRIAKRLNDDDSYRAILGTITRELLTNHETTLLNDALFTKDKETVFEALKCLELETFGKLAALASSMFLMGMLTGLYVSVLSERETAKENPDAGR